MFYKKILSVFLIQNVMFNSMFCEISYQFLSENCFSSLYLFVLYYKCVIVCRTIIRTRWRYNCHRQFDICCFEFTEHAKPPEPLYHASFHQKCDPFLSKPLFFNTHLIVTSPSCTKLTKYGITAVLHINLFFHQHYPPIALDERNFSL